MWLWYQQGWEIPACAFQNGSKCFYNESGNRQKIGVGWGEKTSEKKHKGEGSWFKKHANEFLKRGF